MQVGLLHALAVVTFYGSLMILMQDYGRFMDYGMILALPFGEAMPLCSCALAKPCPLAAWFVEGQAPSCTRIDSQEPTL